MTNPDPQASGSGFSSPLDGVSQPQYGSRSLSQTHPTVAASNLLLTRLKEFHDTTQTLDFSADADCSDSTKWSAEAEMTHYMDSKIPSPMSTEVIRY
jgi:hypothetical protein